MSSPRRRVVYIVVDGMGTDAFEQACASGRAPAFQFIKDNARYVRDSIAIFPTITPAATASLVTGEVPARHGIPGMCWYDTEEQRFVNYGQSPRAAVLQGRKRMVRDFLVNMNSRHLSCDVRTIHERLNDMGVVTASINFLIFRGPFVTEAEPNLVHKLLMRKPLPSALPGPKEHYFADIINGAADACSGVLKVRGYEKRMAATDAYAACVTRELLERGAADMILFYLHENDHVSHDEGPASQTENLIESDKHVAHVLDSLGSWEKTLDEVDFVITADHAQSPVSNDKEHIIDLGEMLAEFEQARPGGKRESLEDNDIAVCGNGRVAFTYLNRDRRNHLLPRVIDALEECQGVDQVIWRDTSGYCVRSERGFLRFEEAQDDGVVDERGNKWKVEGDLEAVSGVVEDAILQTPEYPLALWRIKSALDLDRIGDVVATMKLTWECKDLGGGDHRGGGDHASLHAQDSIVPFVSTIGDPPRRPVTTDVVPHIIEHFEDSRG